MKPWPQQLMLALEKLYALGNYDFCPGANRYVAWFKQPVGWFLVAGIASATAGLCVAPQAWWVCLVVLVVLAMGVIWPWLSMRGLSATLTFDRRRCHEGGEVRATLAITNRWPWPVWGLMVPADSWGTYDEADAPLTSLAQVPAWAESHFEFTLMPPRRGVYPVEPPRLTTGFPFGIWSAQKGIRCKQALVVWPQCVPCKAVPQWQGQPSATSGALVDRAGHDGDLLSARPYVQGDSLRRVHWIHTARRDSLIVCERQMASQSQIVLVLDPIAFGPDCSQETCDWGLRVMAGLCRDYHLKSYALSMELNGQRVRVPTHSAGLRSAFDRLARYQPQFPKTAAEAHSTGVRASGYGMTLWITTSAGCDSVRSAVARQSGKRAVQLLVLDASSPDSEIRLSQIDACGMRTERLSQRSELTNDAGSLALKPGVL